MRISDEELAAKKAAKAAYDREYRAKNREKIAAAKKKWGQSEKKRAYDKAYAAANKERCAEIKKAWRERNPEANKDYYAKNREHLIAKSAAYRAANPERWCEMSKRWTANNPDKARATAKRSYANSRHAYIARARMRKSQIKICTPSWANLADIKDVYQEARYMQMHVDHIVPITHPLVCGLHVWDNLQLLSAEDNLRKSNKFDPETFNAN